MLEVTKMRPRTHMYDHGLGTSRVVYDETHKRYTRKQHAEDYYALAVQHLQAGKYQMARKFADISIYFYEQVNIETIEDAAPTRPIVRGVNMPDIMHEDVVRERLDLERNKNP